MHAYPRHRKAPESTHVSVQPQIKEPIAFYVILHQRFPAFSPHTPDLLTHALSQLNTNSVICASEANIPINHQHVN